MRLAWRVVALMGVVGVAASATVAGCVGNSPAVNGQDSGIMLEDSGATSTDGAVTPDTNAPPHEAGTDATVPDSGQPDSAPATDTGSPMDAADATPPPGFVRFANLTGNGNVLGDLCVSPHGANAWVGPLLAGAGAGSFDEYKVTQYFPVPAGQDDVRLLPRGATACTGADAGTYVDITTLPAVVSGSVVTVAASDPSPDGGVLPTISVLVDAPPASASQASLRVVNVAVYIDATITLTLGTGLAASAPVVTGLAPGQTTTGTNGYLQVTAANLIDLGFSSTYEDGVSFGTYPASLTQGTGTTVFVTEAGGDGYNYEVVTCPDGDLTATGFSNCTVSDRNDSVGESQTRFANFLADTSAPAFDVCIRYQGLPNFAGPLLYQEIGGDDAGRSAGLSLVAGPQGACDAVSGYFTIGGPGVPYVVRFVTPGSSGCGSPGVLPDYTYTPPVGSPATLAATGYLTPEDAGTPGAPDGGFPDAGPEAGTPPTGLASVAQTFVTFIDESFAGSNTFARVIHVDADHPQPLNVTTNQFSFVDVPYGTYGFYGLEDDLPVTANSFGYLLTPAITGSTFNIADSNTSMDLDGYFIMGPSESEADSFFLFGGGGISVRVVMCQDVESASSPGTYSVCSFLEPS